MGHHAACRPWSLTVEAAAEKLDWVREAAGERFATLEINAYPSQFPSGITDHARAMATERAAAITDRAGVGITADELSASPHQYIGTVSGLCDKLVELRERLGISSFMLGDADADGTDRGAPGRDVAAPQPGQPTARRRGPLRPGARC